MAPEPPPIGTGIIQAPNRLEVCVKGVEQAVCVPSGIGTRLHGLATQLVAPEPPPIGTGIIQAPDRLEVCVKGVEQAVCVPSGIGTRLHGLATQLASWPGQAVGLARQLAGPGSWLGLHGLAARGCGRAGVGVPWTGMGDPRGISAAAGSERSYD